MWFEHFQIIFVHLTVERQLNNQLAWFSRLLFIQRPPEAALKSQGKDTAWKSSISTPLNSQDPRGFRGLLMLLRACSSYELAVLRRNMTIVPPRFLSFAPGLNANIHGYNSGASAQTRGPLKSVCAIYIATARRCSVENDRPGRFSPGLISLPNPWTIGRDSRRDRAHRRGCIDPSKASRSFKKHVPTICSLNITRLPF